MRISDWSSDVCSSDLVLSLGVVFWAIATGKVRRAASRETAALAIGVAGMAVLGSGKLVAGVALMVASAALWPWRKRPGATGGVNVDEAREIGRGSCRESGWQYV